jgi:hypothetical protein
MQKPCRGFRAPGPVIVVRGAKALPLVGRCAGAAGPPAWQRAAGGTGRRRARIWPALLLASWSAAACAPTLDWREVRLSGSAVVGMLPCKPNTSARTVALGGRSLRLSMQACKAGEWTWALAVVDAEDPHKVGEVLEALRQSLQANLDGRVTARAEAQVRGATPHAAAAQTSLVGRRPDGEAVHARLLLFVHGTQVFEAIVMGARRPDATADPFFEALQVRP